MREPWNPYPYDDGKPRWRSVFHLESRFEPEPPATVFPENQTENRGIISAGIHPDLVIDFGTSAIAAALVGNRVEVLQLDGPKPLRDSSFARRVDLGSSNLTDNYEWLRTPRQERELFPCLKRRIELLARTVDRGGWQHEATLDVAGLCARALSSARTTSQSLRSALAQTSFQVYITVPNAFPRAGIEVLRRGVAYGVATLLELREAPKVETLLEAEAVAFGVIARRDFDNPESRRPITTLLVLDAGAGTTDASIVRAHGDSLQVVAHVGLPVGGLDLDTFTMGLKGDFDAWSAKPKLEQRIKLADQLRQARDAKERWLTDSGSDRPRLESTDLADMAKKLIDDDDWPESTGSGEPLADALTRGFNRYLTLAVRSLLASLPTVEMSSVDKVVVSGRASLLKGFLKATSDTLEKEHKVTPPIDADGNEMNRKLAVVQGVGTYIRSAYRAHTKRRPVRSSFEIQLRHSGSEDLELVKSGQALLDGWAVEAWMQHELDDPRAEARSWIDLRLLPRAQVDKLRDVFNKAELDRLEDWASMQILFMKMHTPYCARFGLDFLTLERFIEIDGERQFFGTDRGQPQDRLHPVHGLPEIWYDIFRGDGR